MFTFPIQLHIMLDRRLSLEFFLLLQDIQRLIAPPCAQEESPPSIRERVISRRPGKLVNHDSCDSCREGGDLLCCDRCPAAFHLQCQ